MKLLKIDTKNKFIQDNHCLCNFCTKGIHSAFFFDNYFIRYFIIGCTKKSSLTIRSFCSMRFVWLLELMFGVTTAKSFFQHETGIRDDDDSF